MVTIREDKNNIEFASTFYFPDHNGTMRESIEECTYEELLAIAKSIFRKTENSYKAAEEAAEGLGKMLGWID